MADQSDKKPPTGVKKSSSFKAESETQTAVAMRVPSIKKNPGPVQVSDKLVTAEQTQNASIARKRRMITKNRAQNVRTREKTPEPNRSMMAHEDTTTEDEEESRSPKSPFEVEADDIYAEMKRKISEQRIRDEDDIDIDAIREAHAEEIKDRRRRSISPFAVPSKEDIERLQRKGSFIDPGNKLLTTVPTYALTPKDDYEPGSRKNSLIMTEDYPTKNMASPPSPSFPVQQSKFHLSDPPQSKKKAAPQQEKITTPKTQESPKTPTKQTTPAQTKPKPKPCIKASTNVNEPNTPTSKDNSQTQTKEQSDIPPVRPKRSKSGTRSQGRTSESEMSEDQSRRRVEPEPQKAPKPKERRRTIAAMKRQVPDKSPVVKMRSKSATRPEQNNGGEITKTSSEIIELLQKARNRSVSIPDEDERISNAVKAYVDRSRQLLTPSRLPSSPRRGSRITSPKTIEILSDKEVIDTFQKAQRKSMEMERSRHSSGYVDASQSEITSSCYSSSYSEDESDFDLSKKKGELEWRLSLLEIDGSKDIKPKEEPVKKVVPKKPIVKKVAKPAGEKKKEDTSSTSPPSPPLQEDDKDTKKEPSAFKRMRKNFFPVWREFRTEYADERTKIRRLVNRCFSNIIILLVFCGLGGLVFRYTEGAFENFYKCGVKRVKRDFIDSLWQGSHNLREDDWKSMARNKLWDFETQLHTAHEAGVHSYSGQRAWSFLNSMVYCLTVITTIGYGHIAPSTTTGRAITIVYAIFGIPLFLILLADFGKLFTRGIKFLWAFVRRLYFTGSCRQVRRTVPVQEVMKGLNLVYEAASTFRRPSQYDVTAVPVEEHPPKLPPKPKSLSSNLLSIPNQNDRAEPADLEAAGDDPQTPAPSIFEIDDEFNLPISVAITVLVIYIFFGASIYVFWEEWGFFESFYFVFISMSTIGFGDFVPNHPMYMMGSIVYLVFGLALTSMCINVVQVKLSDSFRQASAKIGATIGLKVSEEDGSLAPVTPPPVEMPAVHGPTSKTPEIEIAPEK